MVAYQAAPRADVARLAAQNDETARTVVTRLRPEARDRYAEALLAYREGKRKTGLTGPEDVALRGGQ